MLYYIKNNVCFISNETPLKELDYDKIIESDIENWRYINWEIIDVDFNNEKKQIISDYKNNKKEIVDVKNELQEIEDTYETYNEQGKSIADLQKNKLNAELIELRNKKNTMILEGIAKYWEGIINEL